MEKQASLLEGLQFVLENCEVVYIPIQYIHKLDVRGVEKQMFLWADDDGAEMASMKLSRYVNITIKEFGDTPEIIKESFLFSDGEDAYESYNGYQRICRSGDIVSIEYRYTDGTCENIYVDYSDDVDVSHNNRYQTTRRVISKHVSKGVNICIAREESKAKYEQLPPAIVITQTVNDLQEEDELKEEKLEQETATVGNLS